MRLHFTRLMVGYPEPLYALPDRPASWRVFTVCTCEKIHTCTTRSDIRDLEKKEQGAARAIYVKLLAKANPGAPLSAQYDEKQCHPAHSFKLNEHDSSSKIIYRIRGADVRLYFIYHGQKNIVIIKTAAKHTDTLTREQLSDLEMLAKRVFEVPLGEFDSRVLVRKVKRKSK